MPVMMRLSRRSFLVSAVAPLLLAQGDDPVFKTGIKVVNILATVRSKSGELRRDLTKDQFAISEDARPQAIRYFARNSDLALTIGLMIDTSMSQDRVLDAERGASLRFIDQVLREDKDRFFVVQFDMSIQVRQALTASRRDLDEALVDVNTPTRRQLELSGGSNGTLLYDAVLKTSKDTMAKQSGRKALILLTDGVDVGSEATLAEAADAAQRADTLIYSILFADSHAYGGFDPGGRRALARMSRETGGGLYEVTKKRSVQQIYDSIQEELRSQYSLGFVSDKPCTISEFRKLKLAVAENGLTVQAREKYWARP